MRGTQQGLYLAARALLEPGDHVAIEGDNAKLRLKGSAVASDAFFPLRDGRDVAVNAGASCIQPGGKMSDDEVMAEANERRIAMVFTSAWHFRH